jgi:serine/threonine-protein kinase
MDHSGKMEPLLKPGAYSSPRLSPDGQRLAISVNSGSDSDLWVYERARDNMTRLTFDGQARDGLWTRDGRHLLYWGPSAAGFVISSIRADGAGEPQRLLESRNPIVTSSLSPDSRLLTYFEIDPKTAQDIWMLPLDWSNPEHPKPGKPEPFLRTPFPEWEQQFSPDGRWIAYLSSESGLIELYVRPFPGPGAKWQISSGGAAHPAWSPGGRELFYESPPPDNRIMAVDYTTNGDSFTAGKPRPWSDAKIQVLGGMLDTDVAPDGKRFVVFPPAGSGEARDQPLHVTFLLNFFDELRRKAPASK